MNRIAAARGQWLLAETATNTKRIRALILRCLCENIDWAAVEGRYGDAINIAPPRPLVQPEFPDLPSITAEEVQAMLSSGQRVQIIDTRPRHYSTRAQDIVEGAVWRDPEHVDDWIGTLTKEAPVVTFCVYGFHVGCESALP